MRPVYLNKDQNNFTRKFMADMAFLVSHKQIRLPKYYFEEGLYFLYYKGLKNQNIEKYFLTKDKAGSEDENFFYFNFPFTEDQIVFQQD